MFHKRIRAWHKERKCMYKVAAIDFCNETIEIVKFMKDNASATHLANSHPSFDEVILMQESGLQDDKKFNVFEGDLIRFEGELFILNYGHYGDEKTKVNGYGWYLYGKEFTFLYVGGGEKIGTYFENKELLEV